MIYIRVEIQTSPVALRYLAVMIWENHRELWEYFKLWKMTSNHDPQNNEVLLAMFEFPLLCISCLTSSYIYI